MNLSARAHPELIAALVQAAAFDRSNGEEGRQYVRKALTELSELLEAMEEAWSARSPRRP